MLTADMLSKTILQALLLLPLVESSSAASRPRSIAKEVSPNNCRAITVDASKNIGTFKNLQGTNNGDTVAVPDGLDNIDDMKPEIAELWSSHGIKQVMIYNWPDVYMGYGETGAAGDATNNANYNWTFADSYIKFVTSHGAKASINFNPANAINTTISSPALLGQIGYMITDRYMNGAHGSGFYNALELFDFYVESDNLNVPTFNATYEELFAFYSGFAKGVARASTEAGVGAWGGNRVWTLDTNYTIYDTFVTQFYKDVKTNGIPIKAATYHFTNAQFSLDPYDVKRVTDSFRNNVLVPAGLPDLPIWITEYELNPGAITPTTPAAIADYQDPAFFASYIVGTTMYGQDTSLASAFTWTGFGYGGYGAGNAYFPPWLNNATNPPTENNVAAAWKLQSSLVQQTPDRLALTGSSPDGFAALAGRSDSSDTIKVLLNNYQLNYEIPREIANGTISFINASTAAYPLLQSNGLLNGQQACFNTGNQLFYIPLCFSFPEPTVRNNPSTSYKLKIENLPWSKDTGYSVVIQRVGGAQVHQVYKSYQGKGNCVDVVVPFPKNAQDLVTITLL